jgi:hypothetical protein
LRQGLEEACGIDALQSAGLDVLRIDGFSEHPCPLHHSISCLEVSLASN